jgi:hypothetical protein
LRVRLRFRPEPAFTSPFLFVIIHLKKAEAEVESGSLTSTWRFFMRSIFIGSTGGEPGQTLATWALATRLKEKGLRVGFIKPYSLLPDTGPSAEGGFCDSDALFFKKVLGLAEPEEVLCPVMLTENLIPEVTGDQREKISS